MLSPKELTKRFDVTINQNNFTARVHAENFAVYWINLQTLRNVKATWEAKPWKDRLKFHCNLKSTIISTEELCIVFAWRNLARRNEIPCCIHINTLLNLNLITAHAEHKCRLIKWSRMVKGCNRLQNWKRPRVATFETHGIETSFPSWIKYAHGHTLWL